MNFPGFSSALIWCGALLAACWLQSPAAARQAPLGKAGAKPSGTIRVSPTPVAAPTLSQVRVWREDGAPKCFRASQLAGVMINKMDAVDILLHGGAFIRARLEKGCASTEFYSGFYITPASDGRLCEDRDVIRSRTGGACEIKKFKSLTPPKAKRK